jgi:phosphoglycolate phosphatase-like HAD superfamily hydrolase
VKLLLFDVDQTLISTGGAGIRALNRAFQKLYAVENAMEGILPHGKTDPGIIREILHSHSAPSLKDGTDGFPTSMTAIVESYLEFLDNEIDSTSSYKILPGIEGILNSLSSRSDIAIGLATGNVEAGARIKLERGNLNRYFPFGGFGSDSENRTELVRCGAEKASAYMGCRPAPDDVFVIGDTPRDIVAGREAGFLTVGVATGKYSKEELKESGATVVISDFEQERDQFLRTTRIE